MLRRFPVLLVSMLLLIGCTPSCVRVRSGGKEGVQGNSAVQPITSNEPPTAGQPSTAPANTPAAAHETPKFVIDALSWAQDYRAAFSVIGKLRAIAGGHYVLKEGEVPPDIHALYTKLHQELPHVSPPPEQADLLSFMQELDQDLGKIVSKLSKPPTGPELDRAYSARESLRPKIDTLYRRLEKER